MSADDFPDKKITDFKTKVKGPFMKELAEELDRAMRIDDNTFLAFDVFNIRIKITEVACAEKFNTLRVPSNLKTQTTRTY